MSYGTTIKTSPEEKNIFTVTEDSEYFIIDTGIKKRYIPKKEKVPVNGVFVKTEILVKALALYPNCEPSEALEKMEKEHPEIK
jgi:hypothetical protein